MTVWPAAHHLARIGLCRGHHAIIGRDKFRVAQLVLRDPQIGFGRLHLRFGALQRPERILVVGAGRETLLSRMR